MERKRALLILGGALAGALALRLGLAAHLPLICPLRRFTGIPCASCGLTRAASALCHGRLAEATGYNIAAVPLALLAGTWLALVAWEAVAQRAVISRLWARCSHGVISFLVVLMLTAWAVNLHRYFNSPGR